MLRAKVTLCLTIVITQGKQCSQTHLLSQSSASGWKATVLCFRWTQGNTGQYTFQMCVVGLFSVSGLGLEVIW
ncbi:unnamed protein product [Pseudo-nitzschia multistriata]|uniref:Uncharacterized protein n=1 Tax=Pseudo-nitzschia multistriata TaxID=183589 RepID=A0A448ZFC9_9STRA|nr:unnamed protein product [Pseudo-nitzschia multistriata]